MAFRVLIVGGRSWVSYARLRKALDAALVNRLPEVEVVTLGGPSAPALATGDVKGKVGRAGVYQRVGEVCGNWGGELGKKWEIRLRYCKD